MTNRTERRAQDRAAGKNKSWRVGLKVATNDDYRKMLLRQRNGTEAEDRYTEINGKMVNIGRPRQPGIAERLTDALWMRQQPDFEWNKTAAQIAQWDRLIRLLAWQLSEIDRKLDAGENMRKRFDIPDEILDEWQQKVEDGDGPAEDAAPEAAATVHVESNGQQGGVTAAAVVNGSEPPSDEAVEHWSDGLDDDDEDDD